MSALFWSLATSMAVVGIAGIVVVMRIRRSRGVIGPAWLKAYPLLAALLALNLAVALTAFPSDDFGGEIGSYFFALMLVGTAFWLAYLGLFAPHDRLKRFVHSDANRVEL